MIGLKNAAFEIAKVPFSFIAGLAFGRDAYNYPLENLETAFNARYVEATTLSRGGAEWGLYRLLTETPLVGQLFQYNVHSTDQRMTFPRLRLAESCSCPAAFMAGINGAKTRDSGLSLP
ncbi:MAG: hypothetical protein ACREJN_18195, partial [Nitrospiraceae bacterium]